MTHTPSSTILIRLIRQKEAMQLAEGAALKTSLRLVTESLRPANLIKNTLKELVTAPVRPDLINSLIGISTGLLARKVFVAGSNNILRKAVGAVVQLIVANKATTHAGGIRQLAGLVLSKLTSKISNATNQNG